jgi:NitT/TauT family transport system substrate-binding protein
VAKIDIMFSRFSAFYSPLIATAAAGFLKAEGLEPEFSVASAARPARATLAAGEAQVIQSAPSASWAPLERGEASDIVHFAQINQRDGFFLAARRPDPAFDWSRLAGAEVLVDHGGQPLAMFRYALHAKGVDFAALQAIDAGGPAARVARAGRAGLATENSGSSPSAFRNPAAPVAMSGL